jgi:hypothetical protein
MPLLPGLLCLGCAGLRSEGLGSGRPDPLQEVLFKDTTARREAVLQEVPVGTSLEQARAIMAGHGFACEEREEEKGPYLLCKVARNSRFMMADVVEVKLYHSRGKVTAVDVSRYLDGP